jgi:hypothetical protein
MICAPAVYAGYLASVGRTMLVTNCRVHIVKHSARCFRPAAVPARPQVPALARRFDSMSEYETMELTHLTPGLTGLRMLVGVCFHLQGG